MLASRPALALCLLASAYAIDVTREGIIMLPSSYAYPQEWASGATDSDDRTVLRAVSVKHLDSFTFSQISCAVDL